MSPPSPLIVPLTILGITPLLAAPPRQLEPVAEPVVSLASSPITKAPGPASVRYEVRVGLVIVLWVGMVEQGRGTVCTLLALRCAATALCAGAAYAVKPRSSAHLLQPG